MRPVAALSHMAVPGPIDGLSGMDSAPNPSPPFTRLLLLIHQVTGSESDVNKMPHESCLRATLRLCAYTAREKRDRDSDRVRERETDL